MKFFIFLFFLAHASASTKVETDALSMVPRGHITQVLFREYSLKSSAGTKIKIEFSRRGELQEASGLNLGRGDEFEPGGGLLSLGSIGHLLGSQKQKIKGEWHLEKDAIHGWIYEVAIEKDSEVTLVLIHAAKGNLISSKGENPMYDLK